jgi:mRNA interferase HicA
LQLALCTIQHFQYQIALYALKTYNISKGREVKTKDLIALLLRNGWKLKRHGAKHGIYAKGKERETVVRHRETDEDLAKAIIKRQGLK